MPDHRHLTEEVAAKCIEKRKLRPPQRHWHESDYALLLQRVRNGERQSDIAREMGLSRSRIGQALHRAWRIEQLRLHDPQRYLERQQKGIL
jgi:hypothetical protein